MAMSVNTSRSGSQRVRVPVFLLWLLGRGRFSSWPTISPRSKWRLYSWPSRQTVTSMYREAYWVAQAPRPLRPREYS